MECGNAANVDLDSMDLYSRIKLRGSTRKASGVGSDILVSKDEKLVNARFRKSGAYCGKRRFSVNLENSAWTNAIALENSRLTSLIAPTEKETDTWKNDQQDLNDQCASVHAWDQLDLLLDEGTAVEMLGKLGQGRTKEYCNQYDFGDLVWGKVQSHPWWPGQIYNEAVASPSVCSTKKEGRILVAFYGDNTYGWLRAQELIPFEKHYAEKSKQTDARLFLIAVEEVKIEIKRRAALGLSCHCQNPSNFLPTKVKGYFEVDVSGYGPGAIFSAKQIEKAREDFRPEETLSFIKKLALSPGKNMPQNLSWMKNLTKILAYRRAIREKFDETYIEDFEVQRSSETPRGTEIALQAPPGSLLVAEAQKKRILTQAAGANYPQKNDSIQVPKCEVNASCGCFSGEQSGDHEMQIRFERSVCSGPEGTCYIPSQKQLRLEGPPDGGNISGCQENLSKKKKVRVNRIKSLARIAGHQNLLELQGGELIATSPIKVEKDSEMGTNFLRNYAEPTMLVIMFPSQTMLPTISELKDKFSCFGPIDETSLRIFWKSSTCQVVYQYKTDAEAAYHYAIQNRTLFSSEVNYCLQAFSIGASELYKSGESVNLPVEEAGKEILSQTSLSRGEFFSELKPTFQQLHLLPDNILEGPNCPSVFSENFLSSSEDNPEISQYLPPLSSPSPYPPFSTHPCMTNQIGINHFVDAINKKHCEVEVVKNYSHRTTTSANSVNVSRQLINLLTSCSDILGDLRHSSEPMAYI